MDLHTLNFNACALVHLYISTLVHFLHVHLVHVLYRLINVMVIYLVV